MSDRTVVPDLYVSKSSIADFIRCPEYWYARAVLGIRTPTDLAPATGNVLHAGVLCGILQGGSYDQALEHAAASRDFRIVEADEDRWLMCMGILLAASEVFRPLHDQAEVKLVEQRLTRDEDVRVPGEEVPAIVRYTTICDALLAEEHLYTLELKTTKSWVNNHYWSRAEVDHQTWFYLDEMERHGYPCESLCWQVIKLPTQKKYSYSQSGFSPTEYIQWLAAMLRDDTDAWFPYMHFENDANRREAARHDTQYWVQQMLATTRWRRLGRNTGACLDFQRRCGFYPVCHEGDTYENKELYQLRRDR